MLTNLHVKNIALIDEAEIDFERGFHALTGETGAGKSILLGSINLALGGKYSKDLLRDPNEPALVELVFEVEGAARRAQLENVGIIPDENQVVITRKFTGSRSVSRINGETVNVSQVKEVASLLIDIHGQHDNQTLLNRKNHLRIIDSFAAQELTPLLLEVQKAYRSKKKLEAELTELKSHSENLGREMSFLKYEIGEIEEAELQIGEDDELEQRYKKMSHGRKISENLAAAYHITGYETSEGCGNQIGTALHLLQGITEYDGELESLHGQLLEIDSLLNDFNRELSDYAESAEFSEEEFYTVENRLNQLNRLKEKYGSTVEGILISCKEKQAELLRLQEFDSNVQRIQKELEAAKEILYAAADRLSKARKKAALRLEKQIIQNLEELNFLTVQFRIDFESLEEPGESGKDSVEFMISMNPGEPLRPLHKVASGGELSRIMLALKVVMADEDGTETLIFDEIDSGISGRTAQKISEKIACLAKKHQVICITHLAQIASMADVHFYIEKNTVNNSTETSVRKLMEEESVMELARIIGGAEITDTVIESAREMKKLAQSRK